ncbi:hypothetical protein NOV72_01560 [Caballeronia novacaledonica]|uniref:Uncharacterized protein n=1 Tax=Caballeronia novacaledonica TaxID=1544861 RepID=A0A2U3I2J3_9BURK|nr:hypothetical protein [Caballeronia novacaledonica]SPB14310.1 hypothetical protein NOV72_01560 [Caballeronia novacaledonica]
MKDDQLEGLPVDTDEWIRLLQTDDGRAAREHLAAGRAIYYRETDTPAGVCVKKYSDGHREWITIDRTTGRESVICTLNEDDPTCSTADFLARQGDDVNFDFDPAWVHLDVLGEEGRIVDLVDEASLSLRLAEIVASTQKANDALDDALSFIAASNLRIDNMEDEPDKS